MPIFWRFRVEMRYFLVSYPRENTRTRPSYHSLHSRHARNGGKRERKSQTFFMTHKPNFNYSGLHSFSHSVPRNRKDTNSFCFILFRLCNNENRNTNKMLTQKMVAPTCLRCCLILPDPKKAPFQPWKALKCKDKVETFAGKKVDKALFARENKLKCTQFGK